MTGPWISGESLSPSRLNVHGGSATLATGFSTNTLQPESGTTVQLLSDLSVQQTVAAQRIELGGAPSSASGLLALRANSAQTDYLFLQDATGAKSNFLLGLRTGDSTASQVDGLNLYDTSHNTMLVRFSSDSVRFYPPIVAPVFDSGGALASTYNAALFLRGSSKESQIQAAITAAAADGIARVYVPASLYPYSATSVSFNTRVQMVREGGNWDVYDVRAYGAFGDNTVSDTSAIQAAVNGAGAGRTVYFSVGTYRSTATIQIDKQNMQFIGEGRDQTQIFFAGAAGTTCIQLDSDNGSPIDAGQYNGQGAGFLLQDMKLQGNSVTLLDNGLGSYLSGSYGIRDWRGGFIRVIRARLDHFNYPFWGVQSDINYFADVLCNQNHSGIYLGPRSDQFRGDHVYTTGNDQAWFIDGSIGHYITHWITDSDGGPSTYPCKIRTSVVSNTLAPADIVFDSPWLESYANGSTAFDTEAFFTIGSGDAVPVGGVIIRNPFILTNLYSTGGLQHTFYCVRADAVKSVVLDGVSPSAGVPWTNLRAIVKVGSGNTVPTVWFAEREGLGGRLLENFSTSTVSVYEQIRGGVNYTVNTVGGTGAVVQTTGPVINAAPFSQVTGTFSGTLTLNNAADAAYDALIVRAGSAADQDGKIDYQDRTGATKWIVKKASGGNYQIIDNVNSIVPLDVAPNGDFHLAAGGAGVLKLNVRNPSGTGGIQTGDGAGNTKAAITGGGLVRTQDGAVATPAQSYQSETALGWYRSGVSTVALSYGSFNLNQARLVSIRTQGSLDSTTLAQGELAISIAVASGASLALRSGNTIYYWTSSASTKG